MKATRHDPSSSVNDMLSQLAFWPRLTGAAQVSCLTVELSGALRAILVSS